MREIFAFARAQGMLTAPRGSVNGSLVAYATDMSDIDPIEHDIIFERFLTIGRKGSMPDVDMDFPSDRRDEVIEYMIRRFGTDHVAQIVTFGTLAARAAVRDVGTRPRHGIRPDGSRGQADPRQPRRPLHHRALAG